MNKSTATIVIGQRVYTNPYCRGDGIVFRITGDQSPESVRTLQGVVATGGRAYFDIVFECGSISRALPECILRGVQWEILDAVATGDEIAAALHHAEHEEARKATEAQAASERRAAEREEHKKNNPTLLQAKDQPNWSPGRRSGANIRSELKKAFPGVKFSVKSDYNSVDIYWTCGPTCEQVGDIVGKYKAGSFNGMEDIYENDIDATFADVFGGAKYIFTHREFDQAELENCWKQLAAAYGKDYIGCNTHLGSEYVSEAAYRILAKYPLGSKLNGIKQTDKTGAGSIEEFFQAY